MCNPRQTNDKKVLDLAGTIMQEALIPAGSESWQNISLELLVAIILPENEANWPPQNRF